MGEKFANFGLGGGGSSSGGSTVLGGGTLLSSAQYAPGTLTTYSVNTTALTAIDTVNATLAFVVPASGIVDVEVECDSVIIATASGGDVNLGLLNHTGGAQLGSSQNAIGSDQAVLAMAQHILSRFHLTGLTPGATVQVDLAASLSSASGITANLYAMGYTGISSQSKKSPLQMRAFSGTTVTLPAGVAGGDLTGNYPNPQVQGSSTTFFNESGITQYAGLAATPTYTNGISCNTTGTALLVVGAGTGTALILRPTASTSTVGQVTLTAAGVLSIAAGGSFATNLGATMSTVAPVSGTAFQPSTTKDTEIVIPVTTGGTLTMTMGPTTGAENTILSAFTVVAGTVITKRIPASWRVVLTLTTAVLASVSVQTV